MKSKILMLTSIYPSPDFELINSTSVCHYFAKEWVKMGYEVKVIYNYHIYPFIFYFFLKLFSHHIASVFPVAIGSRKLKNVHEYMLDGVKVSRIPVYKTIPGRQFSKKEIDRQIKRIIESNNKDGFTPHYITSHFYHPGLELLHALKGFYQVKCSLVLHGKIVCCTGINHKRENNILKEIDLVGFRSHPIKHSFISTYGEHKSSFMCFSGIPDTYLAKSQRSFGGKISRFIYVGNLMRRKYPLQVLKGLHKAYGNSEFTLNYVGEGNEKNEIERYARQHHLENCIKFTGRIPREKVLAEMDQAECLIMISEHETFGLVYIEAMARGCLVVASGNEGMDGIIQHKMNGFLCKAGDDDELSDIIGFINSLPADEKMKISKAAMTTASGFTDRKMAIAYIQKLIGTN
jgi:glycosyltransferase involved in cell wall biosynthesis